MPPQLKKTKNLGVQYNDCIRFAILRQFYLTVHFLRLSKRFEIRFQKNVCQIEFVVCCNITQYIQQTGLVQAQFSCADWTPISWQPFFLKLDCNQPRKISHQGYFRKIAFIACIASTNVVILYKSCGIFIQRVLCLRGLRVFLRLWKNNCVSRQP